MSFLDRFRHKPSLQDSRLVLTLPENPTAEQLYPALFGVCEDARVEVLRLCPKLLSAMSREKGLSKKSLDAVLKDHGTSLQQLQESMRQKFPAFRIEIAAAEVEEKKEVAP